mgnify:CR=1 FL=1
MTVTRAETQLATHPPSRREGGKGARRERWPFSWLPALLPVRLALAATFGIIIAVTAAALVLALEGGRQNTAELVSDRSERIIDSIVERVRLHLEPAHDQAVFLAGLISDGVVDPNQERDLTAFLTAALAGAPQVAAVAVIRTDLRQIRVERQGAEVVVRTVDMHTVPGITEAFDLARAAGGPVWGELLWSERLSQPMVNIRTPLWHQGSFVGVLLTTVTVAELSKFLTRTRDRLGAGAFILYGRELVLAHVALTRAPPPFKSDHPLPSIAEIGDPVLASIWGERRELGALGAVVGSEGGHAVDVNGTRHIFLYRAIDGYSDQPWLIGTHLPLDSIGGEVRRLETVTWIALAAVLAAIAAAWLIGQAIEKPILRLARGAEAISKLDLTNAQRLDGSGLRELDQAIAAHNALVGTVRSFATYVPEALVRRLMAQGQEVAALDERMLTVMFTDIVGFAGIAELLSPTATTSFLNEHFRLLAACIEPEAGTIDKYIGDSLMAFWGAPEPQPDHAERASRAAIAMRAMVVADNLSRRSRGLVPVRMRIGIHSGPTIVGNIGSPGRINYTIVGDTVNMAQRIESVAADYMADDDEVIVLVSEAVAQAAATCPARLIGEHTLSGRRGRTRIFRLD